jgi:hypothetical protein
MNTEEVAKKFIEKFSEINEKNDFYSFSPYKEEIGFSVQKKLSENDIENASMLSFYIPNNPVEPNNKKSIIISATYGKKVENGISVRNKVKLFSPIDLMSKGDYYYDVTNNRLLKDDEEILPIELADEVYENHIKPTKLLKGFWIRSKILFWRIILNKVFNYASIFLSNLLYLLTGDRYSYEGMLGKEVLNNTIIDHHFKDLIGAEDNSVYTKKSIIEITKKNGRSRRFKFFGYETSYWTIRVYSIIILSSYVYLYYYINWKPLVVTKIFQNTLLLTCFIIISLWLVELIIPTILKKLVKKFASFSTYCLEKKIKV